MKNRYIKQKIILRKNLKIGEIVKVIKNNYLVSYYNSDNKLEYDIISNQDIIEEDEYEKIKNRVNLINKILGK